MPALHLTAAQVNKLPMLESGQALYRDTKLQGFGLRVGASVKTYFVEKRVDGRNVRHSLGIHGQITADQARGQAVIKLGEMTKGLDLNADKKARNKAKQAATAQQGAAADRTLVKLCAWYVTHQKSLEKESAQDAEGLFRLYVDSSDFANVPAREFTARQATALLRTVVEQGKVRTAAKLRAYLRAAYALAQGADTNAQAPAALVLFNIETNPIASTGALSSGNRTRDVVLTDAELGQTMRLLASRRAAGHDDALAAVELSVWLGGQRLAQVLRLTAADVDLPAGTVTLLDTKGRRKVARRHVLPLTKTAATLVKAILKVRRATWLFGDTSAATVPDTVARKGGELLREAQAKVSKSAGAKAREIQVRDLRRTAETMLAAMGISKDLRAQLQSHGLGGVQARHYDMHDYMPEKRRALEAWEAHLLALAERRPRASNVQKLNRVAR